jgi:RNase adapter protein RapZ
MAVDQGRPPSFLVYGPVGAGLTTALRYFRDFQFLTVGGVAPNLMDRYLMVSETGEKPVAITPDIDPFEITPSEVQSAFESLKAQYPGLKLLYLSCPTEVLIQRFAAAEKKHPYEQNGIKDAVEREQLLFQALKSLSDYHIDTSSTSDTELRLKIAKILGINAGVQPMTVHLTSFGFKHGVPTEAEMVFDMRFLPNPFYDEALRPFTGMDQAVKDYVFSFSETHEFLTHWQNLLAHSLPMFQKQGKTRLTIGIGCTGGQHRSVAMTMALSEFLKQTFPDYDIRINHREQAHWPSKATTPHR